MKRFTGMKLAVPWMLLLLLLLLAPALPGVAAEKDPRAVEIAERMMVAMGGKGAFVSPRLLRFDFVEERQGTVTATYRHWWDRPTGRYRVEGVDEDGRAFRVIFNVNDREGKVWVDGSLLDGAEASEMLEAAYGRYVNDTRWLLLPWSLLDDGVELLYQGDREIDGKIHDVIYVAFDPGAGLVPGGEYWALVSRETGRMEHLETVVLQEKGLPGDGPPRRVAWTGWRDVGGGVMLSTRKETSGDEAGALVLSYPLVRFAVEAPDGIFNPIIRPAAQAPPAEPTGTAPADAGINRVLVVLNKADHTASFLETEGWSILRTVPTGLGPHEGAVSRDGKTLYVTDYGAREPGNTITVIDVPAGVVRRTVDLGEHRRPHGIVVAPDGSLFVTAEGSRSVLRLNADTLAIEDVYRTDQDVTHMIVLSPNGKRAYTANIGSGSMTAIDVVGGKVKSIPTGRGAEGIDITPDGGEVWVTNREDNTVSVVNARTLEVEASLPTCEFPIRVKITRDSTKALVSCARSNELQVFDRPKRQEIRRVTLFKIETPIGIVLGPSGQFAYVAAAQSDMVVMVDLQMLMMQAGVFSGREPDGMVWATW